MNNSAFPNAEWQIEFLQQCMQNEEKLNILFRVLDAACEVFDTPSMTEFQHEILSFWLTSKHNDLNSQRIDLRNYLGHVADVQLIRELVDILYSETDYYNFAAEHERDE